MQYKKSSLESIPYLDLKDAVIKEEIIDLSSSLQNCNSYVNVSSVQHKSIVPQIKWHREKPRPNPWGKLEPVQAVKPIKTSRFAKPVQEKLAKPKINAPLENSVKNIVMKVCLADNIETTSESSDNDIDQLSIVFDYDNPQLLDCQGMDYMHTYRLDEQEIQAKREYEIMKRELDKRKFEREERVRYENEIRDKKFRLPDLFNIDIDPIYGKSVQDMTMEKNEMKFDVWDTNAECEVTESEDDVESIQYVHAGLYRTKDKARNKMILKLEADRRIKAYRNRLDKIWAKEREFEKERNELNKKIKEELEFNLAQTEFEALFEGKKVEETLINQLPSTPPCIKRYPNTFKELIYLKRQINRERREARDKAIEREKLFQELGKEKFCKEKLLKVDDFSDDAASISCQSSDGEDGLELGYKNSTEFMIRGLHDKMSEEPRGIHLNRGKSRTTKTCMTREEWIKSIVNEQKVIKKEINSNITDINHSQYDIFKESWHYKVPFVQKSPVLEYIKQEEAKILPTNTKMQLKNFKKPKYIKKKHFNLAHYLYGPGEDTKAALEKALFKLKHAKSVPRELSALEKQQQLEYLQKQQHREKRRQRLRYLGILCRNKENSSKKKNENAENTDSNWVPEKESIEKSKNTSHIQLKLENIPVKISNMRAPEFREPTLKHHPRRNRHESSVQSSENIETQDSRAPFNIPRIAKMDYDKIHQSNLSEPKSNINQFLKYRHHHDHLDHTQQKLVRVKYIPKLAKFQQIIPKEENSIKHDLNDKIFPLKQPDVKPMKDLSLVVQEPFRSTESNNFETIEQTEEVVATVDYIPKPEIPLSQVNPDRLPFIKFLSNKFDKHYTNAVGEYQETKYEYPQKHEYRQELLEEQASVASCLSSASSSICTNFTNDSGSFLILDDKKVPMDYLLKHEIPFVTRTENHMKAELVEKRDEYHGPYYKVPHAGQLIEQREMCSAKDGTGVRSYLGMEYTSLDNQLIGYEGRKYNPRFD